jgi:CRISPR-associated Csx3 family protein
MKSFLMNFNVLTSILTVGFNPDKPADNNEIVRDVLTSCNELEVQIHGKLLKINGRASLQVVSVITHQLAHVVKVLAVYDPKLVGYVVTVSHSKEFKVGDVIPA